MKENSAQGLYPEPLTFGHLETNRNDSGIFFAEPGSNVTGRVEPMLEPLVDGRPEMSPHDLHVPLSTNQQKVSMASNVTSGPAGMGFERKRAAQQEAVFGLLPEPKFRSSSFGVSLLINGAVAGLIIVLTVAQVHEAHIRYDKARLVYMAEPKPYIPPTPKIKLPSPPKLEVAPPKLAIQPPKPIVAPEPPKVVAMKAAPVAPAVPAPAPRRVVAPPAPVVGMFKSAAPAPAAEKVAAVTKAAGFGQPTGVAPNPNATRAANIAPVGAFGASAAGAAGSAPRQGVVTGVGFGSNTTAGSGAGRRGGAVASTGFGSGLTAGTGAHGTVASTGFGANTAPATAPTVHAQAPVTTSLVVLSKPLPQYTAEARELHIEGDVALEVRFDANGQVEVLRVVNGLGHGLDEQAKLAASRIRFRPATKDGHPVDQVSVIHVTFQLA